MRTLKIAPAVVAALMAVTAFAQSPANGKISGRTYVNASLHFSYTWPATLDAKPLPKDDVTATTHSNSYPLFIAGEGDQPYGIVAMAEKLNVASAHSPALVSAAGYVDRLTQSLHPGPMLSDFKRSKVKGASGMVFERLSFQMRGKPSEVLAVQLGGYAVVFKMNAQSAAEMAAMEKSVLETKKTN